MYSLKAIRDAVFTETQSLPELDVTFRSVNAMIQREYEALYAEHDWVFCYKDVDIPIWIDRQCNLTNNPLGPAAIDVVDSSAYLEGDGGDCFRPYDIGAYIQLGAREYKIVGVQDSDEAYVYPAWIGTVVAEQTTIEDWTIRHREHLLPIDVDRVVDVALKQIPWVGTQAAFNGSLRQVNTFEINNVADRDSAGWPSIYNVAEEIVIPAPEDAYTPTAALVSVPMGETQVPAGTYILSYCYVQNDIMDENPYVPYGNPWYSTVTVTAASSPARSIQFTAPQPYLPINAVNGSGTPQTPIAYKIAPLLVTEAFDGRKQYKFLRNDTNTGILVCDISGSVVISEKNLKPNAATTALKIHEEHGGSSKTLKFWPRPNTEALTRETNTTDGNLTDKFLTYAVTYRARCPKLFNDSDSTIFPSDLDRVLIERVKASYAMTRGMPVGQSRYFLDQAKAALTVAKARYGNQTDELVSRNQRYGSSSSMGLPVLRVRRITNG